MAHSYLEAISQELEAISQEVVDDAPLTGFVHDCWTVRDSQPDVSTSAVMLR
jgi:hypothetical protein